MSVLTVQLQLTQEKSLCVLKAENTLEIDIGLDILLLWWIHHNLSVLFKDFKCSFLYWHSSLKTWQNQWGGAGKKKKKNRNPCVIILALTMTTGKTSESICRGNTFLFFFFASLGKTRGIQIRKLMFWGVQLPSVERDLSATGMLY